MKSANEDVPEDVVLGYLKQYMKAVLKSESAIRNIKTIKENAEEYRPNLEKKSRKMGIPIYRKNGRGEGTK